MTAVRQIALMQEEPTSLRIDNPGVRALFTEAARFQSWLDVAAALAELTIIPARMPDSSIHGMRIGLCFRRSLISAPGQLRAIPAPEVPARSDPAANPAAIGCRARRFQTFIELRHHLAASNAESNGPRPLRLCNGQ